MKQHLLKNSLLREVLCLLLCIVGIGNAWGEEYKLITSTSELVAGEKYIIASMKDGNGYVMKNYESGDNWKCVGATASSSTITYAEGMAQLTLGGTDGKWTFNNGTYYIDATSTTSNNYLKGSRDIDEYNKFSISFSNKAAVITCTGKDSRNILRYNSQSNLFACYSSGQLPVYLYKKIDEPEQTKTVTSLSISETPNNTTYYVGEEPSAEGLKVTATYSDNTTNVVTSSVSWSYTPATITSGTKSFTATASYEGKEATSEPFNITIKSIANTAESAYTVAQACTLIDAGKGLSEEVYVKGIVSQVDEFYEDYGSITYWISEDGTTTGQQFQCYGGLNIDGTQFTSINDLKLGSVVVVKGLLKKYNTTYEFDKNNVIVSNDESNARTIESITIDGEATKTYYNIGERLSVDGLTVTANYSNSSTVDITKGVEWTFNPETIAKNTTQVTATATYREVYTASKVIDITVDQSELVYGMESVKGGNNGYAMESKITINDIQWSIMGNTEIIPWRIGGKSLNETDRDIKTMSPVYGTVSKVIVSVGETEGSIAFKSLTLSVANNADFTNATTYKKSNPKASTDYTFYITEATDAYYKITYNVTVSSTYNKYYQFNGVKFYGTPASKDISLTNAGYATFCLPYDATIPEGLTAYTANDNGESVKLTDIENGKIAAGEGVVLHGEAGTYTFVATAEDVSATAGNQMVGVTEETPLTSADNAYMLTRKKDDSSIAFRLLATDYTLGANKAYLKLENGSESRQLISVVWDDNATGIYDLSEKKEENDGAIYNLAGQKLTRTQKGINIINGKLVIK